MDMGNRISHDPLDHYNSEAMIPWTRDPVTTNISLVPVIRDIKKRGWRIIVVDPYRNRTVELADRHIAPAPGADAFLAMAAAKIILDCGAEDSTFLGKYSNGSIEYKDILGTYSINELSQGSGVSRNDADYIAETLMNYKPASILMGWGVHRYKDAHYSIRAIDALGALSGNIGIEGGGVSQGSDEYGPYDQKYRGDRMTPGERTLLMPLIGEEILKVKDPKIRMAFITSANPVCMVPNSQKIIQALNQLEFIVYSGHFMDDTADLADVFLPAATFLEENDVMAVYVPSAHLQNTRLCLKLQFIPRKQIKQELPVETLS